MIRDAIRSHHPKLLELMLRNNIVRASIDRPLEPEEESLLHLAILGWTREELIDILLEHNADTSLVSGKWGTALNEACVREEFGMAKKILTKTSIDTIQLNTERYGTPIMSVLAGCSSNDSADVTIG